ncbi:MAG: hypothetical protein ABL921_33150, partial [Pirellula sp.]
QMGRRICEEPSIRSSQCHRSSNLQRYEDGHSTGNHGLQLFDGTQNGCAYTAEALHLADKFLVDDIPLAKYFDDIGRDRLTEDGQPDPEFPGGMPDVYATIGEFVAGKKKGRESDRERIVAVPIGMSICDIALAQLNFRTARERGVGQEFRLA